MKTSARGGQPSAAIPSIRPQWLPSLIGSAVALSLLPLVATLPYNASWNGTVTELKGSSCTITTDETLADWENQLETTGNRTQRADEQVTISPCSGAHLRVDSTVQVNERTNIWETVRSFIDYQGVSR